MTLHLQNYRTRTIVFKKKSRRMTAIVNQSNCPFNVVVASGPSSALPLVGTPSTNTAAEPLEYNDFDNFNFDYSAQEREEPQQSFFGFPDPLLWNNIIEGVRFQANNFKASTQIHVFQDFDLVTEAGCAFAQPKPTYVCVYITNLMYSDLSRKVVTSCSSNECSSSSALQR